MKIRQYDLSKAELGSELYDAIISGDTRQADSIKAQFVDKDGKFDSSACSSAIRKALRDNDPRIKEAAKARFKGDHDKANKLLDEIAAEGFFSRKDISAAIKAEYNKLKDK